MTAPALAPALVEAERAVFRAAEALQVAVQNGRPARRLMAALDVAKAARDEIKRVGS